MEFSVLGSVFCRHTKVSLEKSRHCIFIQGACRTHLLVTEHWDLFWRWGQVLALKGKHRNKVRPLQMLKYWSGFTTPGKLEKNNFTGARRMQRMKQKFWPERRGMKNKSTRLRIYIACGSHLLCFFLQMQRGCRIRFPNPNALGLILLFPLEIH